MLYSCTHMATVGIKGLTSFCGSTNHIKPTAHHLLSHAAFCLSICHVLVLCTNG